MPTSSSFLSLTLPELNEFVDSWHVPVNNNFEVIDDFVSDLYASLVTSSATSTWAALRGSKVSLAARLDISLNADGTIKLTGSDDYTDMSISATRGNLTDPPSRLNATDFELYDARQPFAGGRFAPLPAAGPSAGFPPEDLDAGIAIRSADFSGDTNHPISSPRIPWAPGLVTGGAVPFISSQGIGIARLTADTIPAVFNIDGYLFRTREIIDFDWTLLAPGDNDYVWIYVERDSDNYLINDGANFKYDGVGGGGAAVKDLRILQSGTLGSTSGSTFSVGGGGGALFNTRPLGKVKAGDVLVIDSGSAAGDYVIDSISSDSVLLIKGTFKADVSGASWHVQDDSHPNIGAVVTDGDPATQPPFAPGRVYIGRAKHRTASPIEDVVVFTRGGVHDSGWMDGAAFFGGTPTVTHNLGQVPSQVEIWVRESAVGRVYQPLVERQVVTKMDDANFPDPLAADTSTTLKLLFPSVRAHTSNVNTTVIRTNATLDPLKAEALFTDNAGIDKVAGQIRVISRL